jgi:hypothetical protein
MRRPVRFALLALILVVVSCREHSSHPPISEPTLTFVEPDSANVAVLLVDYERQHLVGGRLFHFPPCDTCSPSRLPIGRYDKDGGDFYWFLFRYEPTGDSLLAGVSVWQGTGAITYPRSFDPPSALGVSGPLERRPVAWQWFGGGAPPDTGVRNSLWAAVGTVQMVREFGSTGVEAGYSIFYSDACCDPSHVRDRWVVFLYRGSQ